MLGADGPGAFTAHRHQGYMATADIGDRLASPGISDAVLAKFPPTLFPTGTRTADMSPTVVARAKFLKLGVDSQLYVIEGGWHGAHLAQGGSEARDAMAYIAHWFNGRLARGRPGS